MSTMDITLKRDSVAERQSRFRVISAQLVATSVYPRMKSMSRVEVWCVESSELNFFRYTSADVVRDLLSGPLN